MTGKRLTTKDRALIESLREATYFDVRGYKDYSIRPDEEKRSAAKLIMRLTGYRPSNTTERTEDGDA